MEPAGQPYPDRGDWGWLACDREGHLALFVTGGQGPIPMPALHPDYPQDVEQQSGDLPVMSDVRTLSPWPNTGPAERGFFLYNWNEVVHGATGATGAYDLVIAPYRPRTLGTLPDNLAEAARSVRFTQISFAEAWRIDVRVHMSCLEPSR